MIEDQDSLLSLKEHILQNKTIIDALNSKLERKAQEVRVIQEISIELNSTLDLDQILHSILQSMDEMLGFKHSMILLLNEEGNKLTLEASRGYEERGIGAEVTVGQGIIGIVAKRKRIVRMGNISSQMSYSAAIRLRMEESGQQDQLSVIVKLPGLSNVDSQIGIPLLIKDKLVGVFSVESPRPNAFDELDEMVLMILSNQAASVINNARLYQTEKERLLELNKAYANLAHLNDNLEANVRERTAELSSALSDVTKEKKRSIDLLERMAPPQVIPLLLENKLIPRRLMSTILFTDLEGFTKFTSRMEPNEIFSQLNYFFSQAGEQIATYRGYVNKTNGDSIMALFGVPQENYTHAIDAVLAGLRMQSELDQNFRLNMRIGINTGFITAGMLGPNDKILYDVLGDTVNVASRMEKICLPGAVTISELTYKIVEPYFEIIRLGEQDIKGKGAIETFQVVGIRPLRDDRRRVDTTSVFYRKYLSVIDEVESMKQDNLAVIDFASVQSRDGAIYHNESAASFALALLRYLKTEAQSSPELEQLRSKLNDISETKLVLFLLLHDLGKHAMDTVLLNDPQLEQEQRDDLTAGLELHTISAMRQLQYDDLIPLLEKFYPFQRTKDAAADSEPFIVIAAIADIYDALTAPKLYKGRSWSIQGSLEEIMRMPYTLNRKCPIVHNFVDLMRPEMNQIKVVKKTDRLFK